MASPKSPPPAPERRSVVTSPVSRHVLVALCVAAALSYLTRNAIGVAEEDVRRDLGLDEQGMGWVMSAFFLSYALFQIPGGRIAERLGCRRALPLFAVAWSGCSAFISLATGLWSLLATRFVMGAAQAGLFPGSVISIRAWVPPWRRAFACGWLASSMSIGGALASALAGWLLGVGIGWGLVFALFALPGIVWGSWFWRWFRDSPAEHPGVTLVQLEAIRSDNDESKDEISSATPWYVLLGSPPLWMLCGQQAFRAAGYVFFATWFPTFLKKTQGVSTAESGWMTSLPLLAVVAGSPLGGWLVDAIWTRTGSRRLSRQGVAVFALGASAALVASAYFADETWLVLTLITASSFLFGVAGPCGYTGAIDLGGPRVAPVFSVMNMSGNGAAFLCPGIVPVFRQWTGGWEYVLFFVSGLYALAALCWVFLDTETSVFAGPADARDTTA